MSLKYQPLVAFTAAVVMIEINIDLKNPILRTMENIAQKRYARPVQQATAAGTL